MSLNHTLLLSLMSAFNAWLGTNHWLYVRTHTRAGINLALVKGFGVMGVFWDTFVKKHPKDYLANQQALSGWYQQGKVVFTLGDSG